jgi:hypothetical protein
LEEIKEAEQLHAGRTLIEKQVEEANMDLSPTRKGTAEFS